MLRNILGVIAGVIAGGVTIAIFDGVNSILHPFPAGLDVSQVEAFKTHVAGLPPLAFVLLLLGWAVGSFEGALIASLIGKASPKLLSGIVVGFFLLGCIFNLAIIPHPLWLMIATPVVLLAAWFAAATISSKIRVAQAAKANAA